jgi:hypothetical protein
MKRFNNKISEYTFEDFGMILEVFGRRKEKNKTKIFTITISHNKYRHNKYRHNIKYHNNI